MPFSNINPKRANKVARRGDFFMNVLRAGSSVRRKTGAKCECVWGCLRCNQASVDLPEPQIAE